jgi:hypothetical protein
MWPLTVRQPALPKAVHKFVECDHPSQGLLLNDSNRGQNRQQPISTISKMGFRSAPLAIVSRHRD